VAGAPAGRGGGVYMAGAPVGLRGGDQKGGLATLYFPMFFNLS